jgi:hypothetical protein
MSRTYCAPRACHSNYVGTACSCCGVLLLHFSSSVQGTKVLPATAAVALGLLLRYATPIPDGLTDQVCVLSFLPLGQTVL